MTARENTMFTSLKRRWHQPSGTVEDRTMSATVSRRGDYPRSYVACEVMRDGSVVTIRALRADDTGLLRKHFDNLSPISAYFRFFGPKRQVSERELAGLTN